ncbi:MAG: hypothetical protein JNK58_07740, partial [Phycisphaerae bacterium]|nr:hypothetical protein [Phycisphaerae bacterium]
MTAAALMLAIASLGPVVLRGSSQPDERNIVNIDLRGIELASPGADPTLLGWEHIKLVTGDDAPRAEPYTRLADDAWRARSRILRGDARFAAPLLERLTRELHNVRSPTALLAFAGLARARADERDLPAAITAWQRAAELHAQGVRLDPDAASAIHFDQSTGYITDLPAFWFARGEAADRDDFLSLINRALADDPAARSAARSQLRETLPASHNTWREAWTRAALGRSYLREKDAEPRTLGLLELLHLPARFANDQPILTSLA